MFRRIFRRNKSNAIHALKEHNADFVLDNFLEPEVKRILLPLYLAQYFTFTQKYSIRYNFVTSNNFQTNAFIFMFSAGISLSFVYIFMIYLQEQIKLLINQPLLLTTISSFIIFCFIEFVINSVLSITQAELNSFLIIKVQRIHSCFNLIKFDNQNIIIGNWIYVLCVAFYHIIYFATHHSRFNNSFLFNVALLLFMYTEDCNVVVAGRILNFLGRLVNTWVLELSTVLSIHSNATDEPADDLAKDLHLRKINQAYDEIMEALHIYQKVFGLPITCCVVSTFLQGLMVINIIIQTHVWSIEAVIIMTVLAKSFMLLTLYCMTCENVYINIKNANISSIMAMDNKNFKDLARALSMQAEQTRRMKEKSLVTACGLFPVDACLPLRLFAVLASYAVVILQFYFL